MLARSVDESASRVRLSAEGVRGGSARALEPLPVPGEGNVSVVMLIQLQWLRGAVAARLRSARASRCARARGARSGAPESSFRARRRAPRGIWTSPSRHDAMTPRPSTAPLNCALPFRGRKGTGSLPS